MNFFFFMNTIFSEDCPKNILVPYLPEIMGKLESVLKAKAGIKWNEDKMLKHSLFPLDILINIVRNTIDCTHGEGFNHPLSSP